MKIERIAITDILPTLEKGVLLDVRTPAEYEKAHIPGALNLPIFSNEERVKVGATYKQLSKEEAILLGFELAGPKFRTYIESALLLAPEKKVVLYCWRGGMRSGVMAWVLSLYGFDVKVIEGGYKSYRKWTLEQFEKKYHLMVLGGMTGSHKTEILKGLKNLKEQTIDLEGLACHHGSTFGSMGHPENQPTQEQFENDFALLLSQFDKTKKIWVEDESHAIGLVQIPNSFWQLMQNCSLIELQMPLEERVDFLTEEYGCLEPSFLINSIYRIQKRLGPEQTKNAVKAVESGEMRQFVEEVLSYYDKMYRRCILKRGSQNVFPFELHFSSIHQCAIEVLKFSQKINLTNQI